MYNPFTIIFWDKDTKWIGKPEESTSTSTSTTTENKKKEKETHHNKNKKLFLSFVKIPRIHKQIQHIINMYNLGTKNTWIISLWYRWLRCFTPPTNLLQNKKKQNKFCSFISVFYLQFIKYNEQSFTSRFFSLKLRWRYTAKKHFR